MIAIISDIHGNYIALQEVLKAIDGLKIKEIYCLGDVAGYYSQVNECCEALRQRDVTCIMGNHDWYMVGKSFCARSKSVNDCIRYQRTIITPENFDWLAGFPVFLRIDDLCMVHGGWTDPIDEYVKPEKAYFEKVAGKFFLSGHTHAQTLRKFDDMIYCNPGSVGQPRDKDNRAAFATFDGQNFQLHRVGYDFHKVGVLMEKAGFNSYYYECLRTGARRLLTSQKTR